MVKYRHLDHDRFIIFLHPTLDTVEYVRVSDGFESSQLLFVVEHDCSERRPVDLPTIRHRRPAPDDLGEGGTLGSNDRMANRIGIDSGDPMICQQLSHHRLARRQTAAQDPTMVRRCHGTRQ